MHYDFHLRLRVNAQTQQIFKVLKFIESTSESCENIKLTFTFKVRLTAHILNQSYIFDNVYCLHLKELVSFVVEL